MSYILDALKKADQERQQGDVPNLKSSSPSTIQHTPSHRNIIWMMALVIIIALVWFKPWQGQISTQQAVQSVPATQTTANIEPALETPRTIQPEPVQKETGQVQPTSETGTPVPTETTTATQESTSERVSIPNVMELPAHTQSTLPTIQISGHIYDAVPANRMIIINGRVEREGRYISDNTILDSITENGIILNHSGTLFSMTVFDSWPR